VNELVKNILDPNGKELKIKQDLSSFSEISNLAQEVNEQIGKKN
jgi:hypothetical protein